MVWDLDNRMCRIDHKRIKKCEKCKETYILVSQSGDVWIKYIRILTKADLEEGPGGSST